MYEVFVTLSIAMVARRHGEASEVAITWTDVRHDGRFTDHTASRPLARDLMV